MTNTEQHHNTAKRVRLGVNIDHVATLREARGTRYPDPIQAAFVAEQAGADGITVHPREDGRHIQHRDVRLLNNTLTTPMNLEMAVTEPMLQLAEEIAPKCCCLVPEKREELTTEGGLDVIAQNNSVRAACRRLADIGSEVSLFIDPDVEQIKAALDCGAPTIELHTGAYADAINSKQQQDELERIRVAARYASELGLIVNAGHGLHYHNVEPITAIREMNELNIGHAIIARALFSGLHTAVADMRTLLERR